MLPSKYRTSRPPAEPYARPANEPLPPAGPASRYRPEMVFAVPSRGEHSTPDSRTRTGIRIPAIGDRVALRATQPLIDRQRLPCPTATVPDSRLWPRVAAQPPAASRNWWTEAV